MNVRTAQCLAMLALCLLAAVVRAQPDPGAAWEPLYKEALRAAFDRDYPLAQRKYDEALAEVVAFGPGDERFVKTYLGLYELRLRQSDRAGADAVLAALVTMGEKAFGAESAEMADLLLRIGTFAGSAIYTNRAAAEDHCLRALAIREELWGANDPRLTDTLTALAKVYERLASTYGRASGYQEKRLACLNRAAMLREGPEGIAALLALADAQPLTEAEPTLARAITLAEGTRDPAVLLDTLKRGVYVYNRLGETARQLAIARRWRAEADRAGSPDAASSLYWIYTCALALGRYPEAEEAAARRLARQEAVVAAEPRRRYTLPALHEDLGDVYMLMERHEDARRCYTQAAEIVAAIKDGGSLNTSAAEVYAHLAACLAACGDAEQARTYAERALAAPAGYTGGREEAIAIAQTVLGRFADAEAYYRAPAPGRNYTVPITPDQVRDPAKTARFYQQWGKPADAEPYLKAALARWEGRYAEAEPGIVPLLADLARCAAAQGKHDQAREHMARAARLIDALAIADAPWVARIRKDAAVLVGG